jgi:Ubiquitin-2 like Rad60 SUMO-like
MFKYAKRAYQDDESDEDKESNEFFESSKKRKKANSSSQSKKKVAPVKVGLARKVIDVENSGSDSDSCVIVEKQIVAKSAVSQLLASIETPINEDFSYDINEDENIKKANELLSKIDTAKRKMSTIDDDVSIILVPPVISTLVLPTVRVRTAAEKHTAKTETSAESLLGSLFASSSSPSAKASSDLVMVDAPGFRIITRLNGKHEGRFKLSSTDTISKLREGLAKLYDLKTTVIKLRFDGSFLNDRSTLDDLEIEDDVMIDVLIPPGIYDAAVLASDRVNERRAAAAPAAKVAELVADVPGVRIITRLNGKHEGRFKLASTDTFSKLREGLGKLYDLKTTVIKLRFDGSIVDDRTTLEDLEIEDDYMIDVLIPLGMYEAAVVASEGVNERRGAAAPAARAIACPEPVVPRRVSAPVVVNNDVNEQMTIHIVVPPCLTVTKATSAEFDIKVFVKQTLQSLHDVLLKQPTLSLQKNVCYAVSTNLGEDLNMDMTFKELSVAPEARLIMRFKPMLIMFIINGFLHPETKEPITEPLTVKLRGDTLFGKVMQSMAKYVGEKVDVLSFYFEGKYLNGMKGISLTMLGVTDASEIEIRRN